jgi:hypothetical protein
MENEKAIRGIKLVFTQLKRVEPVTDEDKKQCEIMYNMLRAHGWIHLDYLRDALDKGFPPYKHKET